VTTTQTLAPGETPAPGETLAPGQTPTPEQTTTPAPTSTQPVSTTITAIVSGDSAISLVDVTGTRLDRLVVTGTVVSGPGQGIGQPPGTVYQYVDLEPAQDTPIDQAVISFAVPLSWMDSNQLSPQNVILNRLDGNAWTALPTTFVKTDGVQDYFTAISPVFSRVAITGQFTSAVTAVQTAAPVSPSLPITVAQTAQPTPLPTTKSPVSVWVPVTAVIGALLMMAVLSGRSRKNS
jgi:PGF-pre-PGF domain-containing protein